MKNDRNMTYRLNFRVSKEQYDELNQIMEKYGFEELSTTVRNIIFFPEKIGRNTENNEEKEKINSLISCLKKTNSILERYVQRYFQVLTDNKSIKQSELNNVTETTAKTVRKILSDHYKNMEKYSIGDIEQVKKTDAGPATFIPIEHITLCGKIVRDAVYDKDNHICRFPVLVEITVGNKLHTIYYLIILENQSLDTAAALKANKMIAIDGNVTYSLSSESNDKVMSVVYAKNFNLLGENLIAKSAFNSKVFIQGMVQEKNDFSMRIKDEQITYYSLFSLSAFKKRNSQKITRYIVFVPSLHSGKELKNGNIVTVVGRIIPHIVKNEKTGQPELALYLLSERIYY